MKNYKKQFKKARELSSEFKRITLTLVATILVVSPLVQPPSNVHAAYTNENAIIHDDYERNPPLLEEGDAETELQILDHQMDEGFFGDVAQLATDNWDDGYIGEIIFTIGNSYMLVDGEQHRVDSTGDASPVIIDNEILLPVTTLIEETGGSILIDDDQQSIIIDHNRVIELEIDDNIMYIDGELQYVDTAPTLIDNSVMMSTDIISEELGFEVEWNPTSQEVILTRDFQTQRLIMRLNAEIDLTNFGAITAIKDADNMAALQFNTIEQTQEAYELLSELAEVVWIEPDLYIPASGESIEFVEVNTHNSTNPTHTGPSTWNVDRVGTNRYAEFVSNARINRQITVAVVDSGVDINHAFLRDRIDSSWCVRTATSQRNPRDNSGHGTHVAGIVVANTPRINNVRLMSVRVFDTAGSTDSIIARGIRFAVDNGANVINASFVGPRTNLQRETLDFAISRNVTIVAASGNDARDASNIYPAAHERVITVAAANSNNGHATFSNHGSVVDVAAPGVSIISSWPGGSFGLEHGTSMAAPHVSAAAAMYIMVNPAMRPANVQSAIRSYVNVPNGWERRFGVGILNMQRAITTPSMRQVTFNPQGGSWPTANGVATTTATLSRSMSQASTNYSQVLNTNNRDILVGIGTQGPARPAPTRAGYTFDGWYTAATGGSRVNHNTQVAAGSGSITLHARWRREVRVVTFNPQGGSWSAASGVSATTATLSRSMSQASTNYSQVLNSNNRDILTGIGTQGPARPVPTRAGYSFVGWYTAATGGSRVNSNTQVAAGSGSITLHARWRRETVRQVTFNPQGGSWPASTGVAGTTATLSRSMSQASTNYNQVLNTNNRDILAGIGSQGPARPVPTRAGYSFVGWYTAATGGSRVNNNTQVAAGSGSITLHARWRREAVRHVTFNPQGGSWPAATGVTTTTATLSRSMSQASTNYSQVLNTNNRDILTGIGSQGPARPIPTRAGYTFVGWYTAATGGTRVNHNTRVTAGSSSITLHARWRRAN